MQGRDPNIFDKLWEVWLTMGVQMKFTYDICLKGQRTAGRESMWHRVSLMEAIVGGKL